MSGYRDPIFPPIDWRSPCANFDSRAEDYLREHPDAWRLFCRFALQLVENGATRAGAKAIVERIRWEQWTSAHGIEKPWAWDNSLTASVARAFARTYPEHAGLFRFHERRAA